MTVGPFSIDNVHGASRHVIVTVSAIVRRRGVEKNAEVAQ
jgi:hypothetical protein